MYKWEHVYQDLRRRITEGEFPPDSHLPSIFDLTRHYRVSTNTVRQALGKLRDEGAVAIEQGRETLVLRVPVERPIAELIIEMGAAVAAVEALWQELRRRAWDGAA
jgi:DNA-binding GntR family transcriptional regulator